MYRRLASLALGLTLVAAGCQSDRPDTAGKATEGPTTTSQPRPSPPKASPRWETLTTFSGTGVLETPEFEILPGAIQWRVRWSCEAGALRIGLTPPPRKPGPLVDASCPGRGDAFSIQTGRSRLGVEASGPWRAVVDQQLETPLDEPLPPEAASAPVVAQGPFYNIEKEGKGTARLHRLGDGRIILRLEGFEVTQNVDLFVWLSEAPRPRTSAEAVAARKVSIGNLRSTAGNQNYEVPAAVPLSRIRSIVIWCEPVAVAYSAAALSR
jgi:hypothetical protein